MKPSIDSVAFSPPPFIFDIIAPLFEISQQGKRQAPMIGNQQGGACPVSPVTPLRGGSNDVAKGQK